MKVIFIFTLSLTAFASIGQVLRYESCTNCPNVTGNMSPPPNGYTYSGSIQNMGPTNVASDFGRRASNSRWHMGIDFSSAGADADVGDKFFPIETGTITRLKGTGYKYIAIRGTNRFAYGHMFYDGIPPAGGMRSGNFILKAMDAPHQAYYAIIYINGTSYQAISERNGGTVTHPSLNNNQPITVTNQVTSAESPIAPIGDSGDNDSGDDDFAAHIHLYHFQNDPVDGDTDSSYPAGFNSTFFRNAKNPLEILDYTAPNYTISYPATTLTYPGNQRSNFNVRVAITGATGGSGYSSIMDIESVQLFLKRTHEHISEYKLYQGPILESKIVYGGRLNANRYPSINFPGHNIGAQAIDIARGVVGSIDQVGSATRTGILPSAYSTQPYDDFFFSDFYSRIHKDDNYGGANARFAIINDQARYPDGEYNYYAKVSTAEDVTHDGAAQTLLIDNFKPYIKEVIVRAGFQYGNLVYRGRWEWNGSQLVLYRETFGDLRPGEFAWIKVITSESMPSVEINIPSVDGANFQSMLLMGPNRQEFFITYNPFSGTASREMRFSGAGLESMNISPKTIPVRQAGTNVWLPAASPGNDQNHFFNTGLGSCSPPPGGRTLDGECLVASFDSNVREGRPAMPIEFTSYSSGTDPVTYAWSFGLGASPATATTAGPHTVTYGTTGSKTVSLTVTDISGSVTSTKNNYLSITNNPSAIDFTASMTDAVQPAVINFTTSYNGSVNSYNWSFPGGLPSSSTSANPQVTYSGTGTYDVTLTINGVSTKTKAGYITVTPAAPPVVSLTHCNNYYYTGCSSSYTTADLIYLWADVSGGTLPYSYTWNFGDGTISSGMSNETGHSYLNSGTYTVTVTITDYRGVTTSASTSISLTSVIPFLDTRFTISDTYVTATDLPVIFTDDSQTNVDLSNAEYYWDFGVGAYPRFAYTKGPHSVCYDKYITTKQIYYRVFEPSYYLYDYMYGTVNVVGNNLAYCTDYTPQYNPTPGSASAGVPGNCLYPDLFGIPNGDLANIVCDAEVGLHDCPFSAVDPCFEGTIYASHGDPSLKSNNNNSIRLWAHSVVDINNTSGGTRVKSEGIFYQHPRNFQPGVKYTFTFYARIAYEDLNNCSDCGTKAYSVDHLKISLTSGLRPTFECQPDDGSIYRLPNYELSRFTLGSFDYALSNTAWACYEVYFYPPNGNFNQIWIYPEMELSLVGVHPTFQTGDRMTWMLIDNLSLRSEIPESECPAELIVQHSTAGNIIVADQRVTTMGAITIEAGQTKRYEAGETITLAPGFTASTGSIFTATQGVCTVPGGRNVTDIPIVDIYRQNYLNETLLYDADVEPNSSQLGKDPVTLFPNPAKDQVTIKLNEYYPKQLKLVVYDVMGMMFYQDYITSEKIIDISLFSNGLYVVRVEFPGRAIIKQFIKR